jgi:hypothetical protein
MATQKIYSQEIIKTKAVDPKFIYFKIINPTTTTSRSILHTYIWLLTYCNEPFLLLLGFKKKPRFLFDVPPEIVCSECTIETVMG